MQKNQKFDIGELSCETKQNQPNNKITVKTMFPNLS